jgi:PCRF domain
MAELAREEVETLQQKLVQMSQNLKVLLLPKDPLDDRNIMLEVRPPMIMHAQCNSQAVVHKNTLSPSEAKGGTRFVLCTP